MSEPIFCVYCGDPIHHDIQHDCWVKARLESQESLQPTADTEYLAIGDLPGDAAIPLRVRQVDLSHY